MTAFLEAYDLDWAAIRPTFEKFRTLQLLDLTRWGADQRPERLKAAIDDLVSLM